MLVTVKGGKHSCPGGFYRNPARIPSRGNVNLDINASETISDFLTPTGWSSNIILFNAKHAEINS
jgi:hypothetical protein